MAYSSYWTKERQSKYFHDWYQRNRTRFASMIRKRLYGVDWEELLNKFNHKCSVCGATSDLCVDHIISVSRGGKSTEDNLRVLCRSCNALEGKLLMKKDPEKEAERKYMSGWRKKHPGYFTKKSREFRKRNPGYHTKRTNQYRQLYHNALVI